MATATASSLRPSDTSGNLRIKRIAAQRSANNNRYFIGRTTSSPSLTATSLPDINENAANNTQYNVEETFRRNSRKNTITRQIQTATGAPINVDNLPDPNTLEGELYQQQAQYTAPLTEALLANQFENNLSPTALRGMMSTYTNDNLQEYIEKALKVVDETLPLAVNLAADTVIIADVGEDAFLGQVIAGIRNAGGVGRTLAIPKLQPPQEIQSFEEANTYITARVRQSFWDAVFPRIEFSSWAGITAFLGVIIQAFVVALGIFIIGVLIYFVYLWISSSLLGTLAGWLYSVASWFGII